ncbi:protein kinase domain-containing protein [Phthorimaea operculella]|nr:protein kinase domain-containing protein [Phthorimaea operculella]
MEPSKEAIAVRITRLNRQILGKTTSGTTFVDKYRSTLAELRRTRVCLSDFDIVQTIGRGHFGEVHMVREKQTSDVYAMKVVRKEVAMKRAAGAAEDERDVLATATAPWVPRLQYAFQDASSLYLVMELCSGGDLGGLLSRRNHPLSERDAAFYVAETAHALKALHGMGYVHRDVKPGNILLDRCGHVKLGDFGSCARLSEGEGASVPVGTPDYVAPELLAAAECAARHTVCALSCRGIAKQTAISACDYWSLGVVAFELVTMRRPFSSGDGDSIPRILGNIQKYEREVNSSPPFDPAPNGPSDAWRSLVAGLLTVQPDKRYNYLDTLQHAALSHLASHTIRDQAPPWVPCTRGPEDASFFHPPPRAPHPPSAAPFRARPPFAGQLPYVGYSYVAPEQNEDHSGGFNSSHDCTAINLATFKSAEKLAVMRGKEIASLQSKLAAAESAISAEAEKTRRAADAEAERQRARLQAEITALSLQNRRLERQIEVEKEERMALERTNQQLSSSMVDRTNAEVKAAQANAADLRIERDGMREEVRRLEARVAELQVECARAAAQADTAHQQQKHYKNILEEAKELRHRQLTEINVRVIDTIAKERALRRQTLSGGEAECREAGAKLAQAEANLAKEKRTREQIEKRLETIEAENRTLQKEIDEIRKELSQSQEMLGERRRYADQSTDQLREAQTQLAHEKARVTALQAQVRELERGIEEAGRREAALEEQCSRTEARFNERLEVAEARAAAALKDDARHREKVNTLEQLVRQLEREVSALESRTCTGCEARTDAGGDRRERDGHSDTESVGEGPHVAQAAVLKEQLERAEAQLQARADEIAALRQEARTANLARWRKEREYNELSVEAKSTAREVKRLEERLSTAVEARKEAEKKASSLQSELNTLKPQYERATRELERVKEQLDKLKKAHEVVQAEVDRSRNDIRKLKSELQYSEKRRMHAEEQEELSSRERAQLRDELTDLRVHNNQLIQNNKALQEACSLLEDQLTDLEKLADMHEGKNKDLESEVTRIRSELEGCRNRLAEAERMAAQQSAAANDFSVQHEQAKEQAHHALCQLALLRVCMV